MSGYQPTRGRRSCSKSCGRSSSSNRDDRRNIEIDSTSEDEVVRLGNTPGVNGEEDESPMDSNCRRVRRRGSNKGTPLPNSPGERQTIVVKTPESFDNPDTTREITCIFRGYSRGVHLCYSDVPRELDDDMFKAFADKFKWPDHSDDEVHKVFSNIAGRRLRDHMREARKFALQKSGSKNPLDWRPYKQEWFDGPAWIKALEYWATEEWQRISEINKKNRHSTANGEFPKHTCGSVSSAVHEDRMTKELKRRPTPLELYVRTHSTASRDYVDSRARDTVENYNDIVEERWLPSERPDFHPDTWTRVTNGIRKGRVFGLGNSQAAMEVKNSSTFSRVRSQQAEIEMLKRQLAEVEENRKKEKIEEAESRRIEMENLKASFQELMQAQIKELLSQLNLPNSKYPSSSGSKPI